MNRLINPSPRIDVVPLTPNHVCVVVDNLLNDPETFAAWARDVPLHPPAYPYPGVVATVEGAVTDRFVDFFNSRIRRLLGGRRTLDGQCRLSLVCTPPAQLRPVQWLCHRDRISSDPGVLFAASVLYLFKNPQLGGTSFYRPSVNRPELEELLAASQHSSAEDFQNAYGVEPGYMGASNRWFERVATVPAAWNRAIFYDGGLFHSADVPNPQLLSPDVKQGRLTFNGFFTCRRNAG